MQTKIRIVFQNQEQNYSIFAWIPKFLERGREKITYIIFRYLHTQIDLRSTQLALQIIIFHLYSINNNSITNHISLRIVLYE